ncbi:M81 family metallopeptidase [Holdemania massiliensis]|uniref:Microcystin degradation protein MlrC n=1 Tax=Holdemania massiliensis TaxID=1468449 RepID=A0A6N7S5J2_9FIRM|nr:M81 family metallopeptidase [Holdemania massiliensis]MSA70458.1 microcystin degradation protein MlrC [Holdemania massiliensis]MSA88915.1 microcystin degradation protein MlrC [Holdemania massiliensis]MSB77536.1 microcystin degradation protein MlrC [Holdemania massiliensis]MSC32462.1 microcystin degradation protein MlrC [Holdemania massiliensis]MSC38782.1 microcystin degradation protein MlrC [Holdemania massiliensis]
MKVLVGSFTTESNAKAPYKTLIQNYDLATGEALIDVMEIREAFAGKKVEIIPGVYANANAASVVDKKTFLLIESMLLNSVWEHLHEIDGIYLHLHGASWVEEIGSGDHHIIQEIRRLVGPYLPIAVSCDPHGNLTKTYVESLQILRSYRESPHTDAMETRRQVAEMLCDLIQQRQTIHAVYRKLPLILGGEQSVSADEPVRSINRYMDELEQDPRIRSVSWHVGYLRHDCPEAGCGIVVVPQKQEDQAYAETLADQLAEYVWNKRHEFHYTGLTAEPEEALTMALNFEGKPFVITDSGDNTTSGATGWNTFVLRQFLAVKDLKKTVLFASLCDPQAFKQLAAADLEETVTLALGTGYDELSAPVSLTCKPLARAPIPISHGEVTIGTRGEGILAHVENTTLDILVADQTARVTNESLFAAFGIDWKDYDITVLKQGYIFPDFKQGAQGYVMSLTDGATPQDTRHIPFKLIQRPMYPIDEI